MAKKKAVQGRRRTGPRRRSAAQLVCNVRRTAGRRRNVGAKSPTSTTTRPRRPPQPHLRPHRGAAAGDGAQGGAHRAPSGQGSVAGLGIGAAADRQLPCGLRPGKGRPGRTPVPGAADAGRLPAGRTADDRRRLPPGLRQLPPGRERRHPVPPGRPQGPDGRSRVPPRVRRRRRRPGPRSGVAVRIRTARRVSRAGGGRPVRRSGAAAPGGAPRPAGRDGQRRRGHGPGRPASRSSSVSCVLRYLTAGESHGRALVVIVEGLPAGLPVQAGDIADELKRRRLGYGRGPRMRFEADEITLTGGIRHGRTLGSPVAIEIANSEWPKWTEEMSPGTRAPGRGPHPTPPGACGPAGHAEVRLRRRPRRPRTGLGPGDGGPGGGRDPGQTRSSRTSG